MAVIEQRYAQALCDLALRGVVDAEALRSELRAATGMVEASAGLRTVLGSPAVAWEKKLALLDALVVRAGLSRLTRNFLAVAAQRGRIHLLAGIDASFEQLLLAGEGIAKAEIASARDLLASERAAIEKQLTAAVGRKLRARYTHDPSLIGGFTARVGDKVYDGSIDGRLRRLRQSLLSA